MTASSLIGFTWFLRFDVAVRILIIALSLTLVTEVAAAVLANVYHNNLLLYNLFTPIEYVMFCLYFNYSIAAFRRKRRGWYIIAAGLAAEVLNRTLIQPLGTENNIFILLEGAVCIASGLYALYVMMRNDSDWHPARNIHFWLSALITLYWASSIILQALQNLIARTDRPHQLFISILVIVLSMLYYGGQGIIFFIFRKSSSRG